MRDAPGGLAHWIVAQHDGGRLAAKLERDWREIARRLAHDDTAYRWRAGENEMVEGQGAKDTGVLQLAADQCNMVFGEDLAQHGLERGVGGWRCLRHLDHDAVAGGQRGNQRAQRQIDREIPGRDDTNDALGLVGDAQAVAGEQQLGPAPARPHPAAHMRDGMTDLQRGRQHLQHLGLGQRASAKILGDRFGKHVLVAQELLLESAQVPTPLPCIRQGVAQEGLLLRGEHGLHAGAQDVLPGQFLCQRAAIHADLCCSLACSTVSEWVSEWVSVSA